MSAQPTDRKLLEFAAKAAGVRGSFTENHPEDGAPCYSCGIKRGDRMQILWNPLVDDGDAMRLLVSTGLTFRPYLNEMQAFALGYRKTKASEHYSYDPNKPLHDQSERMAAARRSVVRAAAEIGKAMP